MFNELDCSKCLNRIKVDIDVDHNYKRIDLQKRVNEIMAKENIKPDFIARMVDRYMEVELINNSFMEKSFNFS